MTFKMGQEIFVPAWKPSMGKIAGERGIGTGKEYKLCSESGDDFGWWSEEDLMLAQDARLMFTEEERCAIDRMCLDVELPTTGGKPLDHLIPAMPQLADRLAALSREFPKSNKQFIIFRSIKND